MLFFNLAQTFFLDKSAVQNATEVAITRVDLYFRAKPPATNNKSGIEYPGVELLMVPCLNGIPVINQMGAYRPTEPTEHGAKFAFYSGGQIARKEYSEIQATTNASAPTTFLFDSPVFVHTDKEYAVIIKFDGNENFVLWSCKIGDKLVGSDEIATGGSGSFTGHLYQFIDNPNKSQGLLTDSAYAYSNTTIDPSEAENAALLYTATTSMLQGLDSNYLLSNWSPLSDQNLKFNVHVARYTVDGVAVTLFDDVWANVLNTSSLDRPNMFPGAVPNANGIIQLTAAVQTTEYVLYDLKSSSKSDLVYGEPFFQDGPEYPGGTATPMELECYPGDYGANDEVETRYVRLSNANYALAGNVSFTSTGGFANLLTEDSYLVLHDSNNDIYLRQVDTILSNTEILVDSPFDEGLSNVTFRVAPIGFLNDVSRTNAFGKLDDIFTLYNSTANSEIRFTSYSVANVEINDSGTGYSNSDYILIEGYEEVTAGHAVEGNYAAYVNVVTDASGNITTTYVSNVGAGFVNTAWLVGANVNIYQSEANGNPTATPSGGSGANLTINISSSIKSAFTNTNFANCRIINLEALRMKPEITVNNPLGTSFTIRHRTLFHTVPDANTASGQAYYIDTPSESQATDTSAKIFKSSKMAMPGTGKIPVLTSRSNEFTIKYSANGSAGDTDIIGDVFSNTAVFIFDISSNSDHQAVYFDPEIVTSHYGKYIINPDYTNEHTNYGDAWAKHVATKINLTTDRFAEDCLVYLTAYRPANTDLKVYARLHNSRDETAFDDTDWTLLEQVDGIGVYSSLDNDADYVELTYNLPAYPNTDFTLDGSVTLTQGNAHVIGDNTIFGPRITINDGGTNYVNGDIIQFESVPYQYDNGDGNYAYKASVNATYIVATDGSGVITGLTANDVGVGWDDQTVVSTFTAYHANGDASVGTSADLDFYPGVQTGDLIKIYSPYVDWANTNYTIAVVNSVISNTELTVKRTFGELAANSIGNVSINTTSTTLVGDGTFFDSDVSVGDFIAVWANASVYETHKIISIASNTSLTMDSNGTFANTATKYAYITPDTFMNVSTNVTELLVDRLAYNHQAFNFVQNDNVARYYNKSMVEFDTYDTIQIKVVFLSPHDSVVPKIDDIRGILVTA